MTTTLNQRIKAAREAAGITQQDIARACGISRNSVSMWESADAHGTTPTIHNLAVVLDLLKAKTGCPVRAIAGWMLDDESTLLPPWLTRRLGDDASQPPEEIPHVREDLLLLAVRHVDLAIEQHARGQPVSAELRAKMLAAAYSDLVLFENSKSKISSKLKSLVIGK